MSELRKYLTEKDKSGSFFLTRHAKIGIGQEGPGRELFQVRAGAPRPAKAGALT